MGPLVIGRVLVELRAARRTNLVTFYEAVGGGE